MEFKKIQLNGFKSFADKTNFLIEEGLTGIVGPNGCGKSNIVESLRWAMGETSAKSMRGSGMEDVIFSGTSNKASKNIAEVSIEVENKRQTTIKDQKRDVGAANWTVLTGRCGKDGKTWFADTNTGSKPRVVIDLSIPEKYQHCVDAAIEHLTHY